MLNLGESRLVCKFNQLFPYVTSLAASRAREILSGSVELLLRQRLQMPKPSAAETDVRLRYTLTRR